MAELSQDEKFKAMLATDKKVWEQLLSIELFLSDPKSKALPEYEQVKLMYDGIRARYEARQDDYKNNTLYKLGNSINEYADKTVQWFKDTWNSFFGLGLAPLVVPVAIAAGAALSVTAVAYFIYAYYSETATDYNEGLKTLELLARHNPKLADKLAKTLTEVKNKETDSGLFTQVGVGLKWALISVAVVGTGVALYGANQKYKFI